MRMFTSSQIQFSVSPTKHHLIQSLSNKRGKKKNGMNHCFPLLSLNYGIKKTLLFHSSLTNNRCRKTMRKTSPALSFKMASQRNSNREHNHFLWKNKGKHQQRNRTCALVKQNLARPGGYRLRRMDGATAGVVCSGGRIWSGGIS
jgi:hypothetical protein